MNNLMLLLFLVSIICIIVGLIKPDLVIRWGDVSKRTRKKAVITYVIATVVFFVLFGVTIPEQDKNKNKNETASTTEESKTVDSKQEDNDAEEKEAKEKAEAEVKELENKYEPILIAGKDYANMTNEEGNIANEMISNWNKLSDEYKDKYKSSKESISNSIKTYNEKKKEEEEAKKAAEKAAEEAQKAAEEAAAYDTGITYDQLARTPDDYNGKKVKFSGKVIQVLEDSGETDLRIAVGGNYETILLVAYDPSITSERVLENDNVTIKGISKGIKSYTSTMGAKISLPIVLVNNIVINK